VRKVTHATAASMVVCLHFLNNTIYPIIPRGWHKVTVGAHYSGDNPKILYVKLIREIVLAVEMCNACTGRLQTFQTMPICTAPSEDKRLSNQSRCILTYLFHRSMRSPPFLVTSTQTFSRFWLSVVGRNFAIILAITESLNRVSFLSQPSSRSAPSLARTW